MADLVEIPGRAGPRRIRALIAVGFAVVLAGCGAKQSPQVIAGCQLQAMRAYPHMTLETSLEFGDYIQGCMADRGFQFNVAPASCALGGIAAEGQASCYIPANG